jgi:hypothetical protein
MTAQSRFELKLEHATPLSRLVPFREESVHARDYRSILVKVIHSEDTQIKLWRIVTIIGNEVEGETCEKRAETITLSSM